MAKKSRPGRLGNKSIEEEIDQRYETYQCLSMLSEKNILYEDDDLLVINKPAGILTVPTPKKEKYTLTSCLEALLRERGVDIRAYPCHRLDRDTSGLIIYAKKKPVQDVMMQQFKNGQVKKSYIAFVAGIVKRPSGVISFPVENKKAVTKYKLLQKRRGYSIIEAAPTTGRTNQVRIHCAMIGHPLLGERKFAFGKDFRVKFRRVALHASTIDFRHPVSGKALHFYCPLPDDMSRLVGGQVFTPCFRMGNEKELGYCRRKPAEDK